PIGFQAGDPFTLTKKDRPIWNAAFGPIITDSGRYVITPAMILGKPEGGVIRLLPKQKGPLEDFFGGVIGGATNNFDFFFLDNFHRRRRREGGVMGFYYIWPGKLEEITDP